MDCKRMMNVEQDEEDGRGIKRRNARRASCIGTESGTEARTTKRSSGSGFRSLGGAVLVLIHHVVRRTGTERERAREEHHSVIPRCFFSRSVLHLAHAASGSSTGFQESGMRVEKGSRCVADGPTHTEIATIGTALLHPSSTPPSHLVPSSHHLLHRSQNRLESGPIE